MRSIIAQTVVNVKRLMDFFLAALRDFSGKGLLYETFFMVPLAEILVHDGIGYAVLQGL